jgi:hypothetical protein
VFPLIKDPLSAIVGSKSGSGIGGLGTYYIVNSPIRDWHIEKSLTSVEKLDNTRQAGSLGKNASFHGIMQAK